MAVQLLVTGITPDDIDADTDRIFVRSEGRPAVTMFVAGDDLGERIDNLEQIGTQVARVATDEERAENARRHDEARRAQYPEPTAVTA